ncbi:MAG TPA: MgtC/SapB family protein [Trichocoleus sp.]
MDAVSLNPASFVELGLRLTIALLAGALVGYERQAHKHAAGLRTHILVSLGSALFVLIPIQIGIAAADPGELSRVVQGIVTGVGFIGAGVIFHRQHRNGVAEARGLTTAAGIWVVASLGVASGCGLWPLVLLGTIFTWVTLSTLRMVERWLSSLRQD